MALQIWLPLTKDINNQGVSGVSFNNTNSSIIKINSSGKLGNCYERTDASGNYLYSNDTVHLGTKLSMFCWINFASLQLSSSLTGICGTHRHSTNTGMGITIKYVSSTTGYISCNTGTGSSRTYNTYCGSTLLSAGTWYHVGFTYDGSNIKLYVNGQLDKTQPFTGMSVPDDYFLVYNWAFSGTSGTAVSSYASPYKLNDVRAYDHCLSEKEINELAKGLVLHYPLGDPYLEGTTNLYATLNGVATGCYNGPTGKYGFGANTDIYKTTGTFNGKNSLKIYMGTSGALARPYVYFGNLFTSNGTNAPEYKTLSFDYYGTIGTYINFYKLGSGSGTGTWRNVTTSSTGTFTNSGNVTVAPNQWNHIELVLHGTTDANAEWGYGILGDIHTSNTANYWLFANVQLETKDHATGFANYGTTRSGGVVYDTSGFGNNGTTVGEFEIASESPRYSGCTYIKNTSNITHPRCLDNTDQEWTCCAWVKLDASTQSQPMNNFNYYNNIVHATTPLLYLNAGANDYYMYGSEVVPAGIWTHIAFVFKNSTGLRNIYINGVLKNSSGPNKTSTPLGIPDTVILFNNPFSGYVSDYREYATALSADQVKQLYEAPISLANNGTLFANEFNET